MSELRRSVFALFFLMGFASAAHAQTVPAGPTLLFPGGTEPVANGIELSCPPSDTPETAPPCTFQVSVQLNLSDPDLDELSDIRHVCLFNDRSATGQGVAVAADFVRRADGSVFCEPLPFNDPLDPNSGLSPIVTFRVPLPAVGTGDLVMRSFMVFGPTNRTSFLGFGKVRANDISVTRFRLSLRPLCIALVAIGLEQPANCTVAGNDIKLNEGH